MTVSCSKKYLFEFKDAFPFASRKSTYSVPSLSWTSRMDGSLSSRIESSAINSPTQSVCRAATFHAFPCTTTSKNTASFKVWTGWIWSRMRGGETSSDVWKKRATSLFLKDVLRANVRMGSKWELYFCKHLEMPICQPTKFSIYTCKDF